MLEKLDFAGNY